MRSVKEDWIVGGEFNAIINDTEKGGRRKSRATIKDVRDVLEELALVVLKIDRGWFTWVNNCQGNKLVNERLDRVLMSANGNNKFPFLLTNVIRQANSDHDVVAREMEAKDIIKKAWCNEDINIIDKMEKVWEELGPWQHERYRKMVNKIKIPTMRMEKLIDGPYAESNADSLKVVRLKLGYLYDKEESYWAQRYRIRWLKEGDRNTRFFHVRATQR
ncbi:hypothetical protein V6Z11_D12G109000 [Gossypium hirsutum]|uniref:Reverse transcriptase n=1 Tax=Gossypium hirsutum TaxID=3635 RepID=A0A1U8MWE5_GOSHI|nr:uncharacterized protein LOC107942031 [Gossypium hirsutum]